MNQQVDLTPAGWSALLDRQKQLEDSAMADGAARFRRRLEQAEAKSSASTMGGAKRLLAEGIANLEAAITSMIEEPQGRGLGRRHMAARWCSAVGPDVAAYMTLKVVLDGIAKRMNLRKVAFSISELILDDLRYRRFKEQAPGLFEYKLKSFHTSSYAHMARSLNASMNFADIDTSDIDPSPAMRLRLGIKLIDLLIEATGLVETEHKNTPNVATRTEVTLRATDETRKWLTDSNAAMEMLTPVVMPMIVPPLRWEPGRKGGYRFALRSKFPFIRGLSKTHALRLSQTNMPVVYEAINTLQNTAWRVNHRVLMLVDELQRLGGGLAGVPQTDDEKLPAKPADIATNNDKKKKWKKAAHAARERNHIRRQKAVEIAKVLAAAKTVGDQQAIYFPYSLDFRGRIYPIAAYLTPQGDDLSRALLMFADGKPVEEVGARWLAIHGANCMGDTPEGQKVSKMTLDERVTWVHTNTPQIIRSADDPTQTAWWTTAEKPLQFFAFCVEWTNLIRANDKGEAYVCALPCNMDGSCNGIQHYSAMLRDEVGGRAVNVVAQDRPQDIYSYVANRVLDALQVEATKPEEAISPDEYTRFDNNATKNAAIVARKEPDKQKRETARQRTERIRFAQRINSKMAKLWLGLHSKTGLINRKLCKRPTMTFGYGSKTFGFKKQLYEYLRGLDNWKEIREHFIAPDKKGKMKPQVGTACGLMARMIDEGLRSVVVAAHAGMAWMQRAVRGVVARNQAVEWVVPATGFIVRQEYYKPIRRRVTTMLAGSTINPSVWTATSNVNPVKQSNAVAPNFVHSLDAAALMLTVTQAAAEGVEQFAMVHDSYGTVPADCAVLARCCRQSFVRLYTQFDVIADLYSQLAAQYEDPSKCPEPPVKGNLDVSHVLASDYFFA